MTTQTTAAPQSRSAAEREARALTLAVHVRNTHTADEVAAFQRVYATLLEGSNGEPTIMNDARAFLG